MEEQEVRKSVKDLVKTFDTNPKKELKTNQKKEKIPLFPTLKKLPSNVSNKYTEEVNQSNSNNDNKIPRKSMPLAFYKDPEKNDEDFIRIVDDMVDWSYDNFRTNQYDNYQKLTNGILP